jgi:hypothetical protein
MKNPLEREDFSMGLAFLFEVCYTRFVSVRVFLALIVNNISAAKNTARCFLFVIMW